MPRKERGASLPSLPRMLLNRLWKETPRYDDSEDEAYLAFVRTACPDVDLINQSVAHLLSLPLTAVFQPPQLINPADPNQARPLTHYLSQKRSSATPPHFLIMGGSGSGKTTLLRQLARSLATKQTKQETNFLPVLLLLRDMESPIRQSTIWGLEDAIMGQVAKHDIQIKASWIREGLAAGKFLILLDGLDEISDGKMHEMVQQWIVKQMKLAPNAQFVITSRPLANPRHLFGDVTTLKMTPYTTTQIERYVRNWMQAAQRHRANNRFGQLHQLSWQTQSVRTLQRLHQHESLIELARNPLLLRLLLDAHTDQGLPATQRIQFFEQLCTVWLGGWQEGKGLDEDLTADQKRRVLQLLAHHMTEQQVYKISFGKASRVVTPALQKVGQQHGAQFLRMVANRSGLLLADASGHYRFVHPIVQAYLTAVFIQETQQAFQLLAHIEHTWWHQTILFFVAISQNPSPIVHACLQKEPPSVEALTLAETCLQALPNHPEIKRLSERLHSSGDNPNLTVRLTYAQVIKRVHLRNMVRLNDKMAAASELVPNALYQLFVEDRRQNGRFYQPDHWAQPHYPHGAGRKPLLGIRAKDALTFCRWLNETEDEHWFYRLPTPNEAKALQQNGIQSRTPDQSSGYWVATSQTTRLLLAHDDQNHWQAETNFADLLTFDLNQLDGFAFPIEHLRQQLTAQATARTFTLSAQDWLSTNLPVPAVRPTIQLAFDRDTSGQLLNLEANLNALSHAVSNGQHGVQQNSFRQQLVQQGQRTVQAVQKLPQAKKLQLELQLLINQLNKLLNQLPLRPSLIDQTLMRHLNQLLGQWERVNKAHTTAVTNARLTLRSRALNTLLQLQPKQSSRPNSLSSEHQQLHDFCQDLYLDLLIMEGRSKTIVSQRQPPLEGIRLIRERRIMKS